LAAITPPTPIKSKPVVYVRSDSDADILTRPVNGSPVTGTAPGNAPLTVLGRDRDWLKVSVPGTAGRAGWVQIGSLQKDASGVKVGTATEDAATPARSGTSTSAARATQIASSPAPAVPAATSAATSAAAIAPSSAAVPQPPATILQAPVKSRPVVYVTSDSDANILAEAVGGLQIIGTAPSNAPLTVLSRQGNWMKVLVPGTTDRAGWIHIRKLQTDVAGIKVGTTAENAAPSLTPGTSTSAGSAMQVMSTATPAAPSVTNAAFPTTPIKSRPFVYVRSDSDANILAQAMDRSRIIGTASSNTPLTVLGRNGNWLKVLVPGMTNRAGWVHTSSLQTDAGGIRVVPAATAATDP
jgi:uncharacterized protein YgiM (DUF1202 family)